MMQRLVPLHTRLVWGTLGTELRSELTELATCQYVTCTVGETRNFSSGF